MARDVKITRGERDIVGAAEAAEILGVKTPQVSRWQKAGKMPEPLEELKATVVWLRADVEAKAAGRK
jgi:predicted DNA-binding transcriptional regulator AlpA